MPRILAILADGFEEIEAVTPIDLLRRAGAQVTTVSINPVTQITGRSDIILHADTTLSHLPNPDSFDCLLLPGGPGVKALRADPQVRALVKQYAKAGKWIAAICAAPLLLKDAGLLVGKRYTAFPSTASELPEAIAEMRVVQDGKIITSRGAGTSIDFGLCIIHHLISSAKAEEISASICA